MLDIQKLIYIITIAENDFNITRASEELFISQPALSKMIQTIEAEEKLNLFRRKNGRLVGFTPSGQSLYEESKVLLHNYKNMMEKVHHVESHFKNKVRIAAPPFLLRVYLSNLMNEMQEAFPDVLFSYFESDRDEVRDKIIHKAFDLALMTEPSSYDLYGIKKTPLDHSNFCAFISKDHPYAHKEILTWKEISRFPITRPGGKYSTSALILGAIEKENLSPQIALTGSLWDFQITIAFNGKNIALLPEFTQNFYTKEMEERILCKPIKDPVSWDVSLYERRDLEHFPFLEEIRNFMLRALWGIYGQPIENKDSF